MEGHQIATFYQGFHLTAIFSFQVYIYIFLAWVDWVKGLIGIWLACGNKGIKGDGRWTLEILFTDTVPGCEGSPSTRVTFILGHFLVLLNVLTLFFIRTLRTYEKKEGNFFWTKRTLYNGTWLTNQMFMKLVSDFLWPDKSSSWPLSFL